MGLGGAILFFLVCLHFCHFSPHFLPYGVRDPPGMGPGTLCQLFGGTWGGGGQVPPPSAAPPNPLHPSSAFFLPGRRRRGTDFGCRGTQKGWFWQTPLVVSPPFPPPQTAAPSPLISPAAASSRRAKKCLDLAKPCFKKETLSCEQEGMFWPQTRSLFHYGILQGLGGGGGVQDRSPTRGPRARAPPFLHPPGPPPNLVGWMDRPPVPTLLNGAGLVPMCREQWGGFGPPPPGCHVPQLRGWMGPPPPRAAARPPAA